ncbi:hypothetical protein [Streptomyces sp. uw30]|uniref:hypothetical protein n=1 Tax=Streptomyces sp. uw30 TaxID=1828179 RepID=UPI002905967B|nr:hypothetical protein [Streptomyces sp. uw30]
MSGTAGPLGRVRPARERRTPRPGRLRPAPHPAPHPIPLRTRGLPARRRHRGHPDRAGGRPAAARAGPGRHRRPHAGECGTRFTAYADGRALGHIEVDTTLSRPERHTRGAALADIGNLHVDPSANAEELEHRLLGEAAQWLRLCGADRLLAYEPADATAPIDRLTSAGFRELTRTDRGWEHRP